MVITGRLSIRDEKEPQIVINRARPISDFAANALPAQEESAQPQKQLTGTLYLRLATEDPALFRKIRAILAMFPGGQNVVVYFEDTKIRRGSQCALDEEMIRELKNVLGEENVVVK